MSRNLYTCIGKGGEYELLGRAIGAGTLKEMSAIPVYRDTSTGQLFVRTPLDFATRMAPVGTVKACSARIGGVDCQIPRANGSLFCGQHRHADNRQARAPLTNEGLAFMMQRDGEQQ